MMTVAVTALKLLVAVIVIVVTTEQGNQISLNFTSLPD